MNCRSKQMVKKYLSNAAVAFASVAALSCATTGKDATVSKRATRDRVAELTHRLENGQPQPHELPEYFLVAETLVQQRNLELAEKFYQAVFNAEPSLTTGLKLARLKAVQGKSNEADTVIKKLALLFPKSPEPALEHVVQTQLQGNRAATAIALENAFKKHPTFEPIALRYIEFLIENGQREKAKKTLNDAVRKNPQSSYFLLQLGKLKAEDKNLAEAKNLVNRLLQQFPENVEAWALAGYIASEENNLPAAEKYFREAYEKQPDNDTLARFYVVQLLKQNKYEEARRLLLKLEASEEEDSKLDDELSFQLAYVLFQLEDYAEAKVRFLKIAESKADPGRLYFFAGQCDESLKNHKSARENYLKIESTSSFYSMGIQRIVMLAIDDGNIKEAKDYLARYSVDKNEGEMSYRFLATVHAKLKDFKSAEKFASEGAKRYPKSDELAYLSAAYLEQTRSRQASIQALEKFVQQRPGFAPALNHLGYMLAEAGIKLDYAAQILKKALEKEPKNAFYRDSLGWVYFRQKRYDEAEKQLQEAAKTETEEPIVYEHLGEVKLAKKEYSEALKYFERAQSIFAKHPEWKVASDEEWKVSSERVKKRLKELRERALPKMSEQKKEEGKI